ncbi:hypothetical protein O3G_MSEX001737 [Manduca sexta]|uniref:Peroxidase n=1 Tax=Manduca sexta TaxID=7130 RepID=A0A921YL81_MANSE|nr:hypothetical protein O3G_MSEX001737 [Manduca sexta]
MIVYRLYTTSIFLLCGVLIVNSICPFGIYRVPETQEFKLILSSEKSAIVDNSTCKMAISCVKSRYRTIDGTCNNLNKPTWGAASMPYARILPAKYGDDKARDNMDYTLVTMQWGQVVAHDMSLTSSVPQTENSKFTCCNANGNFNENTYTNPNCAPINISRNDPVYGPINKVCMDLVRTDTTKYENCTGPFSPAEQLSAVTAYLDLSIVYGNTKAKEIELRALDGGRLKSVTRDGQEWPPQDSQPEQTCDLLETPQSPCYAAGDVRVNQNTQLTILQVLLLREHNRMADILRQLNPHWSDEVIFQETRRLLIAIAQRITYYHYLPNILGYENMVKHKLIYPNALGYVNDYDSKVDATVFNEHATSAFRYFHTNIQGILK